MAEIDYPAILDEAWEQHLAPRKKNAPTVVSTFAGCGGSSLGYSMAGFKELLAVEWDDNAVETFKLNFPDVLVYHGDIANLSVNECLRLAGIEPGELDILDGSPPCQGFSTAGKRVLSDDRNQLFREFARLLCGLRPKVFVMENVPGMVKGKMKLVFAEVMRELKASGYQVKCKKLNAKYFYVPQSRERLIFIGVRNDLDVVVSYPKRQSMVMNIKTGIRGADVSGNPPFNDKYANLWGQIPNPKGTRSSRAANFVIGKGFNNCVKSNPRLPSPTLPKMQTGRGFATIVHWNQQRALSVGEAKRICAFPEQFQFIGKYSQQWERIGNSVPPLFMRAIARHIRTNILERLSEVGLEPKLHNGTA